MSETLDEMKAQSRQPSLAAKQAYINALEHAIAAYQQAEMPEEPDCFIQLGQEMSPSDGDNDPPQWQRWVAREEYAILRAHAARVTVERDEANRKYNNSLIHATTAELHLSGELAAAKEAQARAERDTESIRTLMNCYNVGGWTDCITLLQRAESAERRLAECEKAAESFRDVILNERGAIAENGMTNDQINDVLGEFDNAFAAIAKESGNE